MTYMHQLLLDAIRNYIYSIFLGGIEQEYPGQRWLASCRALVFFLFGNDVRNDLDQLHFAAVELSLGRGSFPIQGTPSSIPSWKISCLCRWRSFSSSSLSKALGMSLSQGQGSFYRLVAHLALMSVHLTTLWTTPTPSPGPERSEKFWREQLCPSIRCHLSTTKWALGPPVSAHSQGTCLRLLGAT